MNWKKLLIAAAVLLVAYLVIATPERSAGLVNGGLDNLKGAGESVAAFLGGVF